MTRSFKWQVREVFSEREPGVVLRQTPTAGERVAEGTTVELRVSKGQNLIDVPNVVGLDEGTAADTLTSASFKVWSVSRPSRIRNRGIVVAQNPLGGQAVEEIDRRDPSLSGARAGDECPGVIGSSEANATAALQAAGFGVSVQDLVANSADEDGVVLDQDPSEGRSVDPGSTITIYVGRLEEPEPPPAEPPPAEQPDRRLLRTLAAIEAAARVADRRPALPGVSRLRVAVLSGGR